MILAPILRRSDIILLQRELAEDAGGIIMSGNGIRSLVGKYLEKCLNDHPLSMQEGILTVIGASCSHGLGDQSSQIKRQMLHGQRS